MNKLRKIRQEKIVFHQKIFQIKIKYQPII
jgi:hypothetical protein